MIAKILTLRWCLVSYLFFIFIMYDKRKYKVVSSGVMASAMVSMNPWLGLLRGVLEQNISLSQGFSLTRCNPSIVTKEKDTDI